MAASASRRRRLRPPDADPDRRELRGPVRDGRRQPRRRAYREADFLDALGEFLRNPWTRLVLIMMGVTCLFLELKMPGVSLPGVIAAICFVLFFWSHSQLYGQMTVLFLLLFLLGIVLLLVEIFVIPGFGVCGIAGIILVVGSLGRAAYGHWPQTPEEWMGYGRNLGPLGLMMLGSLVLALLLARYLPNIPVANRLLLKPLVEENGESSEESMPLAPGPRAGRPAGGHRRGGDAAAAGGKCNLAITLLTLWPRAVTFPGRACRSSRLRATASWSRRS